MTKHIFPYQLCIFLFCWLTCMTTAVRAEGDVLNRIVYLSKSKGTVYVLLGMVSERTDFLFIYDSKVVDNERLVKIEKGSRTLRQAITEIVGIQDLELRVVGNHILINAPVKREHPMEQVVDTLAHFVLEGTLLDKKNGVPIVYATVGVEGTSIGSITNQAGEFRLHLADSLRRKSLVFSHVGYVAQKIDIPLLTAGQHFTLTLEPRIFPLQEVVIRVVHPIRLMREMLEKRMINYSQKPVYFTTFYREGVQYKQKFRSLTEAVFKIYKSPVQSLYAREQVKLLKMSRITDGLEQDTLIARMSGGIDACLQLDIINHLPDFLLADAHKDVYAYTSADVTIVGDHLVNVISFEQKKEVKEPLYCGELYIDSDNGALLQAQIRIHPRYMKQATDMVVQRQARIPLNGMMTSLATNANRRNKDVRLFEMGNIYLPKQLPLTELPEERMQLTLGMYGEGDFFTMKGVIEEITSQLGMDAKLTYDPASGKNFLHPGRQANVLYQDKVIGYLGEVHPKVCANYGMKERTYIAVVDMPAVMEFVSFDKKYEGIAKFPAATRDISMVVPKEILVGQIEEVFETKGGNYLESYELFDIYEGNQILKGHKSVAYSLTFRAKDKNLEEEDITAAMNRILKALEAMGIQLRK